MIKITVDTNKVGDVKRSTVYGHINGDRETLTHEIDVFIEAVEKIEPKILEDVLELRILNMTKEAKEKGKE